MELGWGQILHGVTVFLLMGKQERIPPIVDNDQGPRREDIDKNEDAMEDNDDYSTFDMKEFLG